MSIKSLIRILAIILMLSGLIHIFAIITLPSLSNNKIWRKVSARFEPRTAQSLSDVKSIANLLGHADPAMVHAFCHFDISKQSVILTAHTRADFWQVSLYDTEGYLLYALHNRASKSSNLNLEIKTAGSLAAEKALIRKENILVSESQGETGAPSAFSRSLNHREIAARKLRLNDKNEDNLATYAVLNTQQAFAVYKAFNAYQPFVSNRDATVSTFECQ